MPEGDGGEAGDGSETGDQLEKSGGRPWDRATICVSSQVGCAVDCHFCLTALLGVKRNLTAGEIVGQICAVLNDQRVSPPDDRVNLVFMGMGEPFLNYENFIKAVRLLVEGVGIPESRMTVSTAGVVPRIYDLGAEPVRPKLAISLNASTDELRTRLMPINRKWNLEKLVAAARDFPLRLRERLTGQKDDGSLLWKPIGQDEGGDGEGLVRPVRHPLVPQYPAGARLGDATVTSTARLDRARDVPASGSVSGQLVFAVPVGATFTRPAVN